MGSVCYPAKIRSILLQKERLSYLIQAITMPASSAMKAHLDCQDLNITKAVMRDLAEEVTGKRELPGFSRSVISDQEITCCLYPLHKLIMNGSCEFGKEKNLLLLITLLIQKYAQPFECSIPECRKKIEKACSFMEQNYGARIYLEQICRYAGLSKSTLLWSFTKSKGVLLTVIRKIFRLGRLKVVGARSSPVEAALQTGFADQSHFTSYFNRFIGLAPGVYQEIFCLLRNRMVRFSVHSQKVAISFHSLEKREISADITSKGLRD